MERKIALILFATHSGMFTHAQDHKFSAILGSVRRNQFVDAKMLRSANNDETV